MAHDHPATSQVRRGGEQSLPLAHPGHGAGGGPATQTGQRGAHLGSATGVHGEAGVSLELAKCPFGVRAEDPVDPSSIETERAEALLELVDVVTAQHRGAQVEEAISESVPRFDQCLPGGRVADTRDAEASVLLETLDGGNGGGTEGADLSPFDRMSRRREALLDIGDRGAGGSWPEGELVVVDESGSGPSAPSGARSRGTVEGPRAVDPCPWPPRSVRLPRRP